MKSINIRFFKNIGTKEIRVNSSKSESNRMLIIKALSNEKIMIKNLSSANDTQIMQNILNKKNKLIWDSKDAGTTMRFLTAFAALNYDSITLTGTKRMQKRPIGLLVDNLNNIGAKIEYLNKKGYPPIFINNKINQKIKNISISGNVSSQYISALLMIAPILKKGIKMKIKKPFHSKPYVLMTLNLMSRFGIKYYLSSNIIEIKNQKYSGGSYTIESDWSSASYWYSIVAINKNINKVKLKGLRKKSFQGDIKIAKIMKNFGVKTTFKKTGIIIEKKINNIKNYKIDFKDCPDLAQTIMVVATIKGISLEITGIESLIIKETDRIKAMSKELKKIGSELIYFNNKWILKKYKKINKKPIKINTYKDHRMAMSFAPVASIKPIHIDDYNVIKKSYNNFWKDLKKVGYKIS